MTLLSDMNKAYQEGVASAIHLLLIGQTKSGKSRYVAEAAKAGFEILYLDRDNGLGTLMEALKDDNEAKKRIHYFAPEDLATFLENMLENHIYRWNLTQNKSFSSGMAKPDDQIVEFRSTQFPKNLILSVDSWTSLADNIVRTQAERKKVNLADVDRYSREIYGGTGFRATRIATILQHAPFHVIVQAHPDVFEKKEKPLGRVGSIDEKDMIITEVVDIPISCSRPHGYSMGKYFNEIGWLTPDVMGKHILDFQIKPGRISGGRYNTKGDSLTSHSFANLYFPSGVPSPQENPGIIYMTAAEFNEKMGRSNPAGANPKSGEPQVEIPNKPPEGKPGLNLNRLKR